jgi:hypothetical protein
MGMLFDDVARTLASEQSRRRALGRIGGLVAGAALAGLWPTRVGAQTCSGTVCLAGQCCAGSTQCCGPGCCPSNFQCCAGVAGRTSGCCPSGHPCYAGGCCPPGTFPTSGGAACAPCPAGQTCGTVCCPSGQFCANSATSTCAKSCSPAGTCATYVQDGCPAGSVCGTTDAGQGFCGTTAPGFSCLTATPCISNAQCPSGQVCSFSGCCPQQTATQGVCVLAAM